MKRIPLNVSTVNKAAGNLRRRIVQLVPNAVNAQFEPPRTPFEKYFRDKLLKKINLKEVEGLSVLEVGCGIGDLLKAAAQYKPKELYGTDQSVTAIEIAQRYLEGIPVDLSVAPVTNLPFPDAAFDIVYVLFELQYLNDEEMEKAVEEVCRVSRDLVILVEETAPSKNVAPDMIYRPVEDYKAHFDERQFKLRKVSYLDVAFSRVMFGARRTPYHWVRWVLSPILYLFGYPASVLKPPSYEEAEPPSSKRALWLQKMLLPLTKGLDEILLPSKGITIMRFEKQKLFNRG
ncbi:MAG: hypothetical protein CMN32_17285 [Saprospirales bacterium]|nr:hypothetical protein [Saprospirales bacterium]